MSRGYPRHALRRLGVVLAVATTLSAASACGGSGSEGPKLGLDQPIPTTAPKGTTLVIGDPKTQTALELSGQIDDLPFDVEWANFSGGPKTSQAFRADALDIGAVADIPPLHARWTGLDVRIVAATFREEPLRHPIYELGIAPGAGVKTLADLRGKRIAYSPGQAQGALVLRVLEKAGLRKEDVRLVEMASTDDTFLNAVASKQVDVAPLHGVLIKRYLAKYGQDGATTIQHGLRDDPAHLYVATSSLRDAGKAQAIRAYVQAAARATKWIDEHPVEWANGYYVKHEGLSAEDAQYLVQRDGKSVIPAEWNDVIADHQHTADLLSDEQGRPHIDVARELYDRRFEKVGADAFTPGGAK